MNKKIVITYSIIHFVIDLACAILLANFIRPSIGKSSESFVIVILYNFFAFAMQFPLGILVDKINKNAICAALGCLFVGTAFCVSSYELIAVTIAGIGNSLFHLGGGVDVLNISDRKAALSGIFVSTGALGIFLGPKLDKITHNKVYLIIMLLIMSGIALVWLYNQIKDTVKNKEVMLPRLNGGAILSIICLMITVCIRSYIGMILAFEWKSELLLAVFSILAVIFGKMLGGIIGDKIGFEKISLVSLLVSAICFLFAFENPLLGIVSILFFNMTMPITLTALSNILENNKGMAFGLLTLALFVGAIPKFMGYTKLIFTPVGLSVVTLISALILYIGIKNIICLWRKNND